MLRGFAVTALENQSLWHERDISHSSAERVLLVDGTTLLDYMLGLAIYIMDELHVYPENMQRNLDITQGLVFSQRVLTTLIEKGVHRQTAYKAVQDAAMTTWRTRTPFIDHLLANAEIAAKFSREEMEKLFDYTYYTRHVDEVFDRIGLK